jgi:hypothetical protein
MRIGCLVLARFELGECGIGCGITGGGFTLCFGLCFRACLGAMAGVRVPLILAVLAGCAWACTRVRD